MSFIIWQFRVYDKNSNEKLLLISFIENIRVPRHNIYYSHLFKTKLVATFGEAIKDNHQTSLGSIVIENISSTSLFRVDTIPNIQIDYEVFKDHWPGSQTIYEIPFNESYFLNFCIETDWINSLDSI